MIRLLTAPPLLPTVKVWDWKTGNEEDRKAENEEFERALPLPK